jgi:HAD superfamily 5'-nucleotidase-like hydrolase
MTEALPEALDHPRPERGIFCNRTLNLRAIRAIGFDMDYTLIHYHTVEWERSAYGRAKARLAERGWPVGDLEFDPQMTALGLIFDLDLGNVVKANRFGYVKKAAHGTRMLEFEEQRRVYSREVISLGEPRWVFTNTLFGLSEGCLFSQGVDLLDEGRLPGVLGYSDLYRAVRGAIDETHMEGELKAEIARDPARFVVVDEELPLALLDLKHSGKKLLLITNSEWSYTRDIMAWAFDPHLPRAMTWRDLFDVKIVAAGKPGFWSQRRPAFEIVDDSGLLRPAAVLSDAVFLGGHAGMVESHLGVPGERILYVGDHIFADVNVSKAMLRWRTALVARELEAELTALEAFKPQQRRLTELMVEKERLEHELSQVRLRLQRREKGYGPPPKSSVSDLRAATTRLRDRLIALDGEIAPLARAAGELVNPRWGPLMRAGNDKSHLARQIERHADIYTSRVSNLLAYTPFVYLRSPRGSLPHDSGPGGGVEHLT